MLSGFVVVAIMNRWECLDTAAAPTLEHRRDEDGLSFISSSLPCLCDGVWNVWRIGKNGSFGIDNFCSE